MDRVAEVGRLSEAGHEPDTDTAQLVKVVFDLESDGEGCIDDAWASL